MKTLSLSVLLFTTLVSIVISVAIGMRLYVEETRAIEVEFTQDIDDKARVLEQEIMLNIEVLHALKGVFISSDNVSRGEFKQVATSFLMRHRNIQALEWIPRVDALDRVAMETRQHTFYPDFEFTERTTNQNLVTATSRSQHFPVLYLEPFAGNENALGFDFGSEIEFMKVLNKSRDIGTSMASAGVKLVQANDQTGVFIFLPIYQGEPNTLIKRQQRLLGFIGGVFRIADMFDSAIKRTWVQGIDYTLEDITNDKHQALYSNLRDNESVNFHQNNSEIVYQRPLTRFSGRQWQIHAMPSEGYIAERRTAFPYLVGAFGISATLALAIYVFFIMRHTHMIDIQVKERTRDLNLAKKKLEALSMTDSLTRIGNRRFFDEAFQREWQLAIKNKTRLALLMIDIDNFKSYNDSYGHLAGDQCLIEVAQAIAEALHRPSDVVARYGGEEFVVLLPHTRDCFSPAQRCCSNVEVLNIPHASSFTGPYVTVSVGVASIIPTEHDDMIKFAAVADIALYKAKDNGRNQVFIDAENIKPKAELVG
ncbi:diguanylate cyclase [Shewanella gelidimarina]|uniref:diguanylate cyclase domain-containing protein n=1 Tax=Shewanella gelidimarina TaxID=56813 RepID=UPI00200C3D3B|nr:diguanylate cyclase [Shewanella gelidimarina]MCL1059628.1 diguanylate cyclase [Shewanella gelidimarina]